MFFVASLMVLSLSFIFTPLFYTLIIDQNFILLIFSISFRYIRCPFWSLNGFKKRVLSPSIGLYGEAINAFAYFADIIESFFFCHSSLVYASLVF